MPVDPNEPTYCLCHQVSYGEMIGCDNPDVSMNVFKETTNTYYMLLSYFVVSNRVVPLCLRWSINKAQRKMVLSKMQN